MVNEKEKVAPSSEPRSKRGQAVIQIVLLIGIAFAINVIGSLFYKRIDLTADKRYTLSTPSKTLLKHLDDIVFVKVYLEGKDLPPGFRKLSESTRELLDEFRVIAGDNVQYEFINPSDMPDQKSKEDLYKQLANQGLEPINLQVNENDAMSEKIIFPGAVVTYKDRTMPVELLQQQLGNISPEEVLHNSTVGLEYEFTNAIRKLQTTEKPSIAIIQGHGELKPIETSDIYKTLNQYYKVDYVNLPMYKVGRLDPYQLIIIAKPDSMFTDLEKYKIDQYIMNGGRVLWLVETLNASLDSLKDGVTYSYDYKLNLVEDMLFKYGVRINYDLVQDLNCNYIPLVTPYGEQQRRNLLKWPYYPVVSPSSSHPIVNNLNAVWFQFASTIDTVNSKHNEGVKKTVLLQTSPYTRVMLNPVRIDLKLVSMLQREQPLYIQGPKNLAVLLEGTFNSAFLSRRPSPEALATGEFGEYKQVSKPTKMIVISDGDVIANQVNKSRDQVFPLGYDRFSNQTFGNKDFILNCIDYMLDESGLMSLRSKDFKLRLLDNGRVKSERTYWQVLNMVVPVILIVIFGLLFNYIRRRRFAS